MLQTVVGANPAEKTATSRDTMLAAYRFMLLARVLDDKFAALYRAGKIHGGVFLGRGQEALSAAIGVSLKKTDVFAPLIRDAAGRLAFGEPLLDAVRTYLGSPQGPMRARDGNVHRGRPLEGLFPMISHLGAMISVVNGALLARRLKGEPACQQRPIDHGNHRPQMADHGEKALQRPAAVDVPIARAHRALRRAQVSADRVQKRLAECQATGGITNQRRKY